VNPKGESNKMQRLEEGLLGQSGLDVKKDIQISDVKINFLGENHIHTVKSGLDNREVLVLIHGYGGTSIMYYKMLKEISDKYQVYCIDLLGMGLSSRPDFVCETTEQTIAFFTDSIEEWRKAVGIENFVLAGHSFGGHIACHYAVKYPKNVSKLLLLSPLGFTKADVSYDLSGKQPKDLTFLQRQIWKLRKKFFNNKMSISTIANKYAWLFSYWVKKSIAKRFKIESDQAKYLYEFLLETYKLPESSQKALHYIVNPGIVAYKPLEDCIDELEIPIYVFYGENDWMDDTGAKRVVSNNKENFNLIYITDSGHQLMMENPLELAIHILKLQVSI